jgi:hypothetical protein
MTSIGDRLGPYGLAARGAQMQLRGRVFRTALDGAGLLDDNLRAGLDANDRLARNVTTAGLAAARAKTLGALFDRRA